MATGNLLNLIPFHSLTNSSSAIKLIDFIELIIGLGSPVWSYLVFKTLKWYSLITNEKYYKMILEGKSSILFDFLYDEKIQQTVDLLKNVKGFDSLEYRIIGEPKFKNYDNNSLTEIDSPEILQLKRDSVITIPASFLIQFYHYPKELAAVLIHEIAHFLNKDIFLLYDVRRFIKAVIIVSSIYILTSLIHSIVIDSNSLKESVLLSIYAAIIGKSYYFFGILFVLILLYIIQKKIEIWREAMADQEAINVCGISSLENAEKLLISQDGYSKVTRPTTIHRDKSLTLSSFWIIVAGIIINIISSRVVGQFAYLDMELGYDNLLSNVIISCITPFVIFAGFYYVLIVIAKNAINNKKSIISSTLTVSILLILGASIGNIVFDVIPLIITSMGMPEGFDFIKRHDEGKLLISSIVDSLLTNSYYIFLPLICSWIAIKIDNIKTGFIVIILWILLSSIEVYFIPYIMKGWFAILVIVLTFILLILINYRKIFQTIRKFRREDLLFLPLIALTIAHFAGYGDSSHFAVVNSHAGHQKWKEGKIAEAIYYLTKAANYAKRVPQGWIDLAKILSYNKNSKEAINSAEKAFSLASSWDSKLEALSIITSERLYLRTIKDLEIAKFYFIEAEKLWRNNSRLSRELVASILYNFACLKAIYEKDITESSIYLLESIALNSKLSSQIDNDPDLALLTIKIKSINLHFSKEELNVMNSKSNIDVPTLRNLINKGIITPTSILRFILLIKKGS